MDAETWLPVVNYAGLYEVSDLGRVRSVPRVVMRKNGIPNTVSGRIRVQVPLKNGYLSVTLCKKGVRKTWNAHQLVAEAFFGPAPKGMEILHGKRGKHDNSTSNLSYGTRSQNMLDCVRDGTSNRGSRNGSAKLTEAEARRVKFGGERPLVLMRELHVTRATIKAIRAGRIWKWLQRESI
jgi:hypothetical protein